VLAERLDGERWQGQDGVDLTGPTASSLRRPLESGSATSGRTAGR
jgi:hypothetical protein